MKKRMDQQTSGGRVIISAPIVKKSFVAKNGKVSDKTELYVQRSIQDYFIKFCESEISREELEAHVAGIDSFINAVKMEVEFRKGDWDVCDNEAVEVQSRTGEYVVIFRIIS